MYDLKDSLEITRGPDIRWPGQVGPLLAVLIKGSMGEPEFPSVAIDSDVKNGHVYILTLDEALENSAEA